MTGVIGDVLDAALASRPDAEAIIGRAGTLTYRELDARADAAAGALWELGVRTGDRVAVSLPNDLDVVVAFHGAMRIGAIWVGIGEPLVGVEKLALLRDCGAALFLTTDRAAADLNDLALPLPSKVVVVGAEGQWPDLLAARLSAPPAAVTPTSPAGIAYTSGTTGLPKGIVHSHQNLLLPGAVLVAGRGWGPELRKGDCLPLTILNMLVLTTLLTAQAQGCCIVMDRRDAAGVLDWIRDGAVTHWNGVPAQLHDLAARGPALGAYFGSVVEVWSGGADCPDSLRLAFQAASGVALRSTYGLTEAPTVVSIDPVGTEHRPGTSGRVLEHLLVRALSPDGAVLPPGDVGELAISAQPDGSWARRWTPALGVWKGMAIAPGGDPADEPADRIVDDATTMTGDLGTVDADGWLTVLDRRKLVIVRGGANVYPAEVERVLMAAHGVRAAAVFGIADERLGERVAALIEVEDAATVSTEQLALLCREQLAKYKVPEAWRVVESLPRNAMGKIVRTGLAELLGVTAQGPGTATEGVRNR